MTRTITQTSTSMFQAPVIQVPVLKIAKNARVPVTKENIAVNMKSQDLTMPTYLEKTKKVELDIAVQENPDNFLISNEFLFKISKEVNQSGYKTKAEPEKMIAGEDPKYVDMKYVGKKQKASKLSAQTLNNEKMLFRSGYQGVGDKNQVSEYDRILKGASNPYIIKTTGIFGNSNGANGYNGWDRNSLYYANYLSADGVGKR